MRASRCNGTLAAITPLLQGKVGLGTIGTRPKAILCVLKFHSFPTKIQ